MATTSLLSLEEYLNTSFHPDVEYVDGELKERNVGSHEHARLQALIGAWFIQNEKLWNVQCVTGQRTRTSETNILIPDVALLRKGAFTQSWRAFPASGKQNTRRPVDGIHASSR